MWAMMRETAIQISLALEVNLQVHAIHLLTMLLNLLTFVHCLPTVANVVIIIMYTLA